MSIENKLNYLNDTKNLIRDAIIDKGVEITPETPFREYADKISQISGGGQEIEYIKNCHIKADLDQHSNDFDTVIQGDIGINDNKRYSYNNYRCYLAHNTDCTFLKYSNKWKINIHFFTGNRIAVYDKDYGLLSIAYLDNANAQDHCGIDMRLQVKNNGGLRSANTTCLISTDGNDWQIFDIDGAYITENSEYVISLEFDNSTGYDLNVYNIESNSNILSKHYDNTNNLNWIGDERRCLKLGINYESWNNGTCVNYKLSDCYIDEYDNDKNFKKRHAFMQPKSEATENFRVVGNLTNDNGIYSGFYENQASITDIWCKNTENVILRTKFKLDNFNDHQALLHCEGVINAEINQQGILDSYCFRQAYGTQIANLQPNTWYYLSIKFERVDSTTVRKIFYLSTTGFDESGSPLAQFDDRLWNNTLQCRYGCSSYNLSGHLHGSIDMRESCVVNYNGDLARQYYLK